MVWPGGGQGSARCWHPSAAPTQPSTPTYNPCYETSPARIGPRNWLNIYENIWVINFDRFGSIPSILTNLRCRRNRLKWKDIGFQMARLVFAPDLLSDVGREEPVRMTAIRPVHTAQCTKHTTQYTLYNLQWGVVKGHTFPFFLFNTSLIRKIVCLV